MCHRDYCGERFACFARVLAEEPFYRFHWVCSATCLALALKDTEVGAAEVQVLFPPDARIHIEDLSEEELAALAAEEAMWQSDEEEVDE
jgi:hypothetical protein